MLFITSAHVVSAHNSISAVINNSPFESWKLVTALFMGNFLKLLHFRNKSSPRRLMGSPVMYTFGFWTFLWVLSEQHNFFLWFWEISKIWMYLQLLLLKKMTKSLHVNCPKRQLDDYLGFKNEKKKKWHFASGCPCTFSLSTHISPLCVWCCHYFFVTCQSYSSIIEEAHTFMSMCWNKTGCLCIRLLIWLCTASDREEFPPDCLMVSLKTGLFQI